MNNLSNPLVTIIVPVYNVEEYLRECIESILAQTYPNLEIIIVNDCSPDNSQSIIDEYASKDKRIICIQHKQNQRQGESRNTGIKKSRGEYLLFVDSDDYVDICMVEKLIPLMRESNADVGLFATQLFDDKSRQQISISHFVSNTIEPHTPFRAVDTHGDLMYQLLHSACNKIYKARFLKEKKLFFNKFFYEDVDFGYKVLYTAERIIYTNDVFYFYRLSRKSKQLSTTQQRGSLMAFDVLKNIESVYVFFQSMGIYDAALKDAYTFLVYDAIYWNIEYIEADALTSYYKALQIFLQHTKLNLTSPNQKGLDAHKIKELQKIKQGDVISFLLFKNQELKAQLHATQKLLDTRHSLFTIIQNRLQEKIVTKHQVLTYPKPIRYFIYTLRITALCVQKITQILSKKA